MLVVPIIILTKAVLTRSVQNPPEYAHGGGHRGTDIVHRKIAFDIVMIYDDEDGSLAQGHKKTTDEELS